MIKGQSHGQLPATQTSIASGNATIAQHLLPHVVHPSDVSMSISQTGSTPPGSVSSRGNGANNVRLRRRLSDKDKENSDSDDSFCTDISGESLLEGSSDEDLDENDKTLQNQILKNFVA